MYSLQVDEHNEWSGFAGEWPLAQNCFFLFLFSLIFFNSSHKSERLWMLLMVFMFFSEAEIREDVGRRSFWSLHRTNDFQAESLQTCVFQWSSEGRFRRQRERRDGTLK